MIINLTKNERLNFNLILPGTGSLDTLERVDKILKIIKVEEAKGIEDNKTEDFKFDKEDIIFLKDIISILDKNQQLSFQALSLIRKIVKIEYKE